MTTETDAAQPPSVAAAATYTGPERRSAMRLWQERVDARLKDGDLRMQGIRDDLDINTAATKRVETNTAALVELFSNAQGAFRVLEMLAKLAKPLGVIAMAAGGVLGLWHAVKGGGPKV